MTNKQNWDKTALESYLLYDNWQPEQAMMVLAGFQMVGSYSKIRIQFALDPDAFDIFEKEIVVVEEKMIDRLRKLDGILSSGDLRNTELTPKFFIDWAISKRLPPDWLDWAIENKLYMPNKSLNLDNLFFDKSQTNYPRELDFAIQAWKEVALKEGKGKPKARVKDWLDKNTDLSNEAKERIAIVVNWEKTGGATKT